MRTCRFPPVLPRLPTAEQFMEANATTPGSCHESLQRIAQALSLYEATRMEYGRLAGDYARLKAEYEHMARDSQELSAGRHAMELSRLRVASLFGWAQSKLTAVAAEVSTMGAAHSQCALAVTVEERESMRALKVRIDAARRQFITGRNGLIASAPAGADTRG